METLKAFHCKHSSYLEKVIEHLFIGEVLRYLWRNRIIADVLKAEVNGGGYDVVIALKGIHRWIELKASCGGTMEQKISLRLGDQPSGCVIWIVFDEDTLGIGPFYWFGNVPSFPLPDIRNFKVPKRSTASATGKKPKRSNMRIVEKAKHFTKIETIGEVVEMLFGKAI